MKKLSSIWLLTILMVMCVLVTSCSKDDSGGEEKGNSKNTVNLQPSGNLTITESTGAEFIISYMVCGNGWAGSYNHFTFLPQNGSNKNFSDNGSLFTTLLREGTVEPKDSTTYHTHSGCDLSLICETKLEKGEKLMMDYYWLKNTTFGFGSRWLNYPPYNNGDGKNNSDAYNIYGYKGTIEIVDINKATYEWKNDYSFAWQNAGNITIKFSNVQFGPNTFGHTLKIDGTIKLPYHIVL